MVREKLRDELRKAPNYMLIRRGDTPRDSARNAYNAAISLSGLDEKEPPEAMMTRAGKFVIALASELKLLEYEIHDMLGFHGAAPPVMGDIARLSTEQAKELFDITYATHEIDSVAADVKMVISEWRIKKGAESE